MSKNYNNNEPPKRGIIAPFMRRHGRTVYVWTFIVGLLAAIGAMSGWIGTALPFWLMVAAIFISRLDDQDGNHAELGTFWGGIAVILIMFKVVAGWPWWVWLLIAFPAYVGFASLTTALYEFVSRMFRS